MKRISVIKLGIIAIVIAAMTSQTGVAQSNVGGGRLAGTWEAVVTVRNCATGGAITSFQSVAAFQQGGTFNGVTGGTCSELYVRRDLRNFRDGGNSRSNRLFDVDGDAHGG